MFGDANRIAVRNFGYRDFAVDRRLKVDVVGTDAGSDRKLQLLSLGDALRGQISRPERLRDHNVRVAELALKPGSGAVFVRGHNERVAVRFKILAEA